MSLFNHIKPESLFPYIPLYGSMYKAMPTRYGFVYCGMLFALLVGSINHNNNLGYLLTFFLGALFFVSFLFTFRNLLGISVKEQDVKPVFAGQPCKVSYTFMVLNSSKHGIHIALDPMYGQTIDIDDGDTTRVTLHHATEKRGYLRVRYIHLSTTFPFGLVHLQSRRSVELNCLVFPQPVSTPFMREYSDGSESGDSPQEQKGTGDFTGLDPYLPGDSLKRIHWKGFAGGRGFHTKRFEENETASALFSLQDLPGNDLELKLSQLTYMVLAASTEGGKYGLRLGEFFIPPNRGPAHTNDCLKALALYNQ